MSVIDLLEKNPVGAKMVYGRDIVAPKDPLFLEVWQQMFPEVTGPDSLISALEQRGYQVNWDSAESTSFTPRRTVM